jgi:CRISPR-associated protein Csh1
MLGNSILNQAGYFQTKNEVEKREVFLRQLTIIPKPTNPEKTEFALAVHFDLDKCSYWFEPDKEIARENRDYFFALRLGSTNDKKKFLAANNIDSFLGPLFFDTISYLRDKRKKKKTKNWIDENISTEYDKLMSKIRETFYVGSEKSCEINRKLIREDMKHSFVKIEKDLTKKQKGESRNIPTKTLFYYFINNNFLNNSGKDTKKFPPIFLAKINGRHIMDHEGLKAAYINMAYFDLFERFFIENSMPEKNCHICDQETQVIGKIPLRMKFYGTTNNLYFENLKNSDSYKSFSICRSCLRDTLVGMQYVTDELSDIILGVRSYLLPSLEATDLRYRKTYRSVIKLLNANNGYLKDIKKIRDLLRKANKKNIHFHLLFWDRPPRSQEFNVLKFISDIEYQPLARKLIKFDEWDKHYGLFKLSGNHSIGLTTVRYLLFPSKYSHVEPKPKLFRKDLLDIFEAFIHHYSLNYHSIIRRFITINRLRFLRKNIDELAAFKMILILSVFHNIKPLKGVSIMEGSNVTEIQKTEYKDFFETHKDIYRNNQFRQGLFLLGTVINGIVRAQIKKARKKAEKAGSKDEIKIKKPTSTFLKKMNFSGIAPRRVISLVNQVQEYVQIYDAFEEPGIWANITDRLQGIENTKMKNEEVVFYILTGYSFARYLGMKHRADN